MSIQKIETGVQVAKRSVDISETVQGEKHAG